MPKFRVLISKHVKVCPACEPFGKFGQQGRVLAKGKDPKKAEHEDWQVCQFCAGSGQVTYEARPMAIVNPMVGAGLPTVPSSWQPSEVFEQRDELDRIFNLPGAVKFERMPDDAVVGSVPMAVAPVPSQMMPTGNPYQDFVARLEQMTVEQLKQHADAEEINITGLKTKKEIIEVIKSRLMPVG